MTGARKGAIRAACALAVAGTATASASGLQAATLNLAHGYAPSHMITTEGIEPWMACVTERTGGEIAFNYFPGGQLVAFGEALDALDQGLADITVELAASVSGKLPLNGIALLPDMGDSSAEMVAAWRKTLQEGGGLADEFTAVGARPVLVNVLPPYQIMSKLGPIDTMQAFSGKTVRVGGGVMNLTVAALGAQPVQIGGGEMYIAMERGTIDATILTLSSMRTYGLDDLVTAVSGNGAFGSGASMLAVSERVWGGLTPDQQTAFAECGLIAEAALAQKLDAADAALKSEFAAAGMNVYDYTPETTAEIEEHLAGVAGDYVDRLQERGLPAKQAFEAYKAALGR